MLLEEQGRASSQGLSVREPGQDSVTGHLGNCVEGGSWNDSQVSVTDLLWVVATLTEDKSCAVPCGHILLDLLRHWDRIGREYVHKDQVFKRGRWECLSSLEPREKATHGQCRAESVSQRTLSGQRETHLLMLQNLRMVPARISCWICGHLCRPQTRDGDSPAGMQSFMSLPGLSGVIA